MKTQRLFGVGCLATSSSLLGSVLVLEHQWVFLVTVGGLLLILGVMFINAKKVNNEKTKMVV